jgi:hypothetical protein
LWANSQRLIAMRTLFALQTVATVVAIGVALWYSARN